MRRIDYFFGQIVAGVISSVVMGGRKFDLIDRQEIQLEGLLDRAWEVAQKMDQVRQEKSTPVETEKLVQKVLETFTPEEIEIFLPELTRKMSSRRE